MTRPQQRSPFIPTVPPTRPDCPAHPLNHRYFWRWCWLYSGCLGLGIALSACTPLQDFLHEPELQTSPTATLNSVSVPLTILQGSENSTLALLPVFIQDQGPFMFVLDTGASHSVIDQEIVDQLQLPVTGQLQTAVGVGGTVKAQRIEIQSWRMGDVDLPAGTFAAIDLPDLAGKNLKGLIGSDVLQTFDKVIIDYQLATLTLQLN